MPANRKRQALFKPLKLKLTNSKINVGQQICDAQLLRHRIFQ